MPLLVSSSYEQRRLRLLANRVQGKTILDIGYAQHPNLHLRNVHRVGLDLQAPKIPSGYEEEILGNVFDLDTLLPNRKFDTIICGEFLEHIENPYDLLRKLHAFLAPNGVLLLSTPNPFGFPVVLLELLRSKRFFYTTDHVYYFPPRWMERMLERCGYTVTEVAPVGLWLPKGHIPIPSVAISYQVIYVAKPQQ